MLTYYNRLVVNCNSKLKLIWFNLGVDMAVQFDTIAQLNRNEINDMSYTTATTLIKIKEPSGLLVGMHLALIIDRQEGNDDGGQFHRLCVIESITEVNGDYYLEFENLSLSAPVEILK